MATLTEKDITAPFLGKPMTNTTPGRTTDSKHSIIITDFQYYSDLLEQFGVTPKLKEQWERTGTEIYMTITLDGDTITRIISNKFRETSASARPTTCSLKLTDQELRIIRRVLEHLTT